MSLKLKHFEYDEKTRKYIRRKINRIGRPKVKPLLLDFESDNKKLEMMYKQDNKSRSQHSKLLFNALEPNLAEKSELEKIDYYLKKQPKFLKILDEKAQDSQLEITAVVNNQRSTLDPNRYTIGHNKSEAEIAAEFPRKKMMFLNIEDMDVSHAGKSSFKNPVKDGMRESSVIFENSGMKNVNKDSEFDDLDEAESVFNDDDEELQMKKNISKFPSQISKNESSFLRTRRKSLKKSSLVPPMKHELESVKELENSKKNFMKEEEKKLGAGRRVFTKLYSNDLPSPAKQLLEDDLRPSEILNNDDIFTDKIQEIERKRAQTHIHKARKRQLNLMNTIASELEKNMEKEDERLKKFLEEIDEEFKNNEDEHRNKRIKLILDDVEGRGNEDIEELKKSLKEDYDVVEREMSFLLKNNEKYLKQAEEVLNKKGKNLNPMWKKEKEEKVEEVKMEFKKSDKKKKGKVRRKKAPKTKKKMLKSNLKKSKRKGKKSRVTIVEPIKEKSSIKMSRTDRGLESLGFRDTIVTIEEDIDFGSTSKF